MSKKSNKPYMKPITPSDESVELGTTKVDIVIPDKKVEFKKIVDEPAVIVAEPKVVTEKYLDQVIRNRDARLTELLADFNTKIGETNKKFEFSFVEEFNASNEKNSKVLAFVLEKFNVQFRARLDQFNKMQVENAVKSAEVIVSLEAKIKSLRSDKRIIMWGLILLLAISLVETFAPNLIP